MPKQQARRYEKALAGLSLVTAIALAFLLVLVRESKLYDTTDAMVIVQFLTFAATILGVDYKLNKTAET